MPEQNDQLDVFDLDAPLPGPEAVASRSESDAAPSVKADAKPVARKREGGIKQWHILVGVGVILVGGIVLTSLPSGNHQAPSATSGLLQPQAAMSSAAHGSEHAEEQATRAEAPLPPAPPPVEASPVNPVATTPSTQLLPAAPAAAPAVAGTTVAPAVSAAPVASDPAALAELKAQMGATEASVKQLQEDVAKLTHQLATTRGPTAERVAANAVKHATPHAAPPSGAVIRSLSGVPYTINTIGRGYAWLQAGDHVEIVQPGDRIGTTRVLAVDSHDRRVITSDGIIK